MDDQNCDSCGVELEEAFSNEINLCRDCRLEEQFQSDQDGEFGGLVGRGEWW